MEIKETEDAAANAWEKLKWVETLTPDQRNDWEYILYSKLVPKLEFLKKQLRGEGGEYHNGKN